VGIKSLWFFGVKFVGKMVMDLAVEFENSEYLWVAKVVGIRCF
jgi:hypothetical protein